MIIRCEQCQAKFKLDDSRVTDKGVKVRCAKCKHVFTVTKEQPETDSFDFASSLEQAPASSKEAASFSLPPQQQPEEEEPVRFSFNTDSIDEATDGTVRMDSNPFETSAADSTFAAAADDDFSLSSLEGEQGFAVERNDDPSTQAEVDFDSFDFGGGPDADKTMVAAPASADFGDKTMIQKSPVTPAPVEKEAAQGLDFSDDDMFGTVVSPPVEEPAEANPFDFGTDSFADSMDMGSLDTGSKTSSLTLDSGSDAPFSLGEIDFGDELTSVAVQQVNPDELKPSQEILFAPLVEPYENPAQAADEDIKKAFMQDVRSTRQDELPPLSIASRRKHDPLLTGFLAAAALLLVGVLGYFGFSTSPPSPSDDKGKTVQESGKISVRAVKASYVKNKSAGQLLVISGEAVNDFPKPRAALQVKGIVFDAKGQVLASKVAFGGNVLTEEQLAELPLEKIETAMANQFGDSLANLEVAPGKAVPFMIVIAKPPKEGKDFGIEPSGSTAAAEKQAK
ncbi:MAG: zinc-ribbon domain-containing protein [Deltaproteobacteria bacterium]|nr:zinc-ribbon domain-containing protein [Deltaproteobacteria bacterium]